MPVIKVSMQRIPGDAEAFAVMSGEHKNAYLCTVLDTFLGTFFYSAIAATASFFSLSKDDWLVRRLSSADNHAPSQYVVFPIVFDKYGPCIEIREIDFVLIIQYQFTYCLFRASICYTNAGGDFCCQLLHFAIVHSVF